MCNVKLKWARIKRAHGTITRSNVTLEWKPCHGFSLELWAQTMKNLQIWPLQHSNFTAVSMPSAIATGEKWCFRDRWGTRWLSAERLPCAGNAECWASAVYRMRDNVIDTSSQTIFFLYFVAHFRWQNILQIRHASFGKEARMTSRAISTVLKSRTNSHACGVYNII